MESINVGFKNNTNPSTIKSFIEDNVKQMSRFQCVVKWIGAKDDVNIYEISSDGGPDAFCMIGMAIYALMNKTSMPKPKVIN